MEDQRLSRKPEPGYDGEYHGLGFGTGAEAVSWLDAAMLAYPNHQIPVWVTTQADEGTESPELSIGLLLPRTGKTLILYGITATFEDAGAVKLIIEDVFIERVSTGFVR